MPATLLPHSCRLPRPPSAHSPPSLFLKTDCPPLPAGSWGSSATHRGPIRAGGVGGSGGGLRWRGERRWQVKWLGGRGGLSFTVIQVLSGWRRGKVKWRGVPCLSSVSPLQLHLSCTMAWPSVGCELRETGLQRRWNSGWYLLFFPPCLSAVLCHLSCGPDVED